jgi:hypothetical protein
MSLWLNLNLCVKYMTLLVAGQLSTIIEITCDFAEFGSVAGA